MVKVTEEMVVAGEAVLKEFRSGSKAALAIRVFTVMTEASKTTNGARVVNEPVGFREFYAAYPRKQSPGAAAKIFTAALARGSLQEIVAGAKRYAEFCRGKDPQYIKMPATWLRGDCWKDEISPQLSLVAEYQPRFRRTSLDR